MELLELLRRWFLVTTACALAVNCHLGSSDDEMVDLRRSDECMLVVFEQDLTHESLETFGKEFVESADSEPGEWNFRESPHLHDSEGGTRA